MGWGQPRRDAHPGGRRIAPHRCGCPFGCTPPLAPDGAKDSVPPKGQPQKQDSGRCGNRVTNLNQDLTISLLFQTAPPRMPIPLPAT
jgi:hypothetical protein